MLSLSERVLGTVAMVNLLQKILIHTPDQKMYAGQGLYHKGPANLFIAPANFVCRGYTVFTLSVRPSVRASVSPPVTPCFLNNSKSHCWIFIKPCKHVHICKTNTLDKKVGLGANSITVISLCSSKWLLI